MNLFPAELFRIELFGIVSGAVAKKSTHIHTHTYGVHIGKAVLLVARNPKLIYRAYLYIDCGINVATGQNNQHYTSTRFIIFMCDDVTQRHTFNPIHSMAILLKREMAHQTHTISARKMRTHGSIMGQINKIKYKF